MKKTALLVLLMCVLWQLILPVSALSPARPKPLPPLPELEYTEDELNMFANVVNGEVGGISGTVIITYADGITIQENACTLHKIHACVLDNQVKHELFPDSLRSCITLYWTPSYTATNWRSDEQWNRCRNDVLWALYGLADVPDTVLAATCDPYFVDRYTGYSLWAKVRWDTGWTSGTFYYYEYGG